MSVQTMDLNPEQGPELNPKQHPRRDFVLTAAAAAVLGLTGEKLGGLWHNEVDTHDGSTDNYPETEHAASGHDEGLEGLHVETEGAHEEELMDTNFFTALPVVAQFARLIKNNISNGEKHRPFGIESFRDMLAVEAPRLALLKMDDSESSQHQFTHEATDLAISYALMGFLTVAAEVTDHIEADEGSLFNKSVDNMISGLEHEAEKLAMPDIDSPSEMWEEYAESKHSEVIDIAAQNFGMSAVVAPMATTYTAATMGDALVSRMAQSTAELKYAEKIAAARQGDSQVTESLSADLMVAACEEADEAINGKMGYKDLVMSLSANLQGAGFIGDPPNYFYLLNNGVESWAKASVLGIETATALGVTENSFWLSRTLGVSVKDPAKFFKQSVLKFGDTISGMAKSAKLFDHSMRRNENFARSMHDQLSGLDVDNDESLQKIRDSIGQMPRAPFVFDTRGLSKAFEGQKMPKQDAKTELAVDTLINMRLENNKEVLDQGTEAMLKNLFEGTESPKDAVDKFMKIYAKRENNYLADKLGDALSALLSDGDMSESHKELLRDLKFEKEEHKIDPGGEIAQQVAEAIEDGDVANVEELLKVIDSRLGFLPEGTTQAIRRMWALQTDSDVVNPNHEIGGLGHSSKEVLEALATQILAANSVAVIVKKFLDVLPEAVTFDAKKLLILSFTEGLSGTADNVVAYIFAENVLIDLYKKEYGDDVFEQETGAKLRDAVTSSALLAAVAGGPFTQIGNGPNFKSKKAKPIVRGGKIVVEREKIELQDWFFNNHYAHANGIVIIGQAMYRMRNAEKDLSLIEEEDEHGASPPPAAERTPSSMSRRALFKFARSV